MSASRRDAALAYLAERTGTLEYRFLRYAAVADELEARGLSKDSLLIDVGAGSCDLDYYLRTVRGFRGRYLPVDASIDGTDLNDWAPWCDADFFVAVELLEHLKHPREFVARLLPRVGRAFVATTPNTYELGYDAVLRMDLTHATPLYARDLLDMHATRIWSRSFFGRPNDTLLAVWER